jgi:S-adenosylmethionine:tRNA ribosyltransferase-isomerase
MYDLSDYNFDLPKDLIAQEALARRGSSRLLTVNRSTGEIFTGNFRDITQHFSEGDVIVLNETKVIPARIFGKTEKNSSVVEILLIKEIKENLWEVMLKPARKVKENETLLLENGGKCTLKEKLKDGSRIMLFSLGPESVYEYIDRYGKMPLPPYIERDETPDDKQKYQTVFAKVPGAIAAPTAGLHFTDGIIRSLEEKGVSVAKIVLHVGPGTFKPIKSEKILDHKMHSETYLVGDCAADTINTAKQKGKKIIAVGTTVVRTLESVTDRNGKVRASTGETDLFIYPGYKFKTVDHVITNFHLPKSTLIMLVSAFSSIDTVKKAYETAVKERFRFYSYGDAMLIL